jgi:hypothetical protein
VKRKHRALFIACPGVFTEHRDRMSFADLRPQMEQLPHSDMVQALAFLKSRLRAESAANREELDRRHTEIEAGRKVRWEDLKRELGLP